MKVVKTNDKSTILIEVNNMTIEESDKIRVECNKYLKEGVKNFIFDMDKVFFIDTVGLGVLLYVNRKCGGNVVLKSINNSVLEVLKKTRMNKILKIE